MPRRTLAATFVAVCAVGATSAMPASSSATARAFRPATTPFVGGTLNALGAGDVDYLDPNLTYSSTGYLVARAFSRQLYTYPAIKGKTTVERPDLATAMPVVGGGGTTYRVTIRADADWNTTPARQVTAADVVRGVKITCNPYIPFQGLSDYESLIKGMQSFCDRFAKVAPTAAAIANYVEHTPLPGVKALNARTVQFTLTHPAVYFTGVLSLPAFSPRPVELDAYLPGSSADAQHTVSDGPYAVTTYDPSRSIVLNRNPAWSRSTDPIRAAYVNEIDISEGQQGIQQRVQANNPSADVEFDVGPTYSQARALRAAHDPRLVISQQYDDNPYLVFNTVSPTAHGAMKNVRVRRAISYALNRSAILKAVGATSFSRTLTHVLPPGIAGSRSFNDYPHKLAEAKRLLAAAGHAHPTLKLLYLGSSFFDTTLAHTAQSELKRAGVTIKLINAPDAAVLYGDYLFQPGKTRAGAWDISMVGWGPDWYGQAAVSFFAPLYDGQVLPPFSSNYGLYNSPAVTRLIGRAERAGTARADDLWAQADHHVMADAASYPLDDPDDVDFHAAQVHNFVDMPGFQQGDYTNMWLSPNASS
jgi:peptide/nickel transport system substrate-binding protein